jgi:hypothetical protein
VGGWPGLAELAADEYCEVVGKAEGFVAIVGDVDGGDVEFGHELLELTDVFAGGLVESGEGFASCKPPRSVNYGIGAAAIIPAAHSACDRF